MRRRRVFYWLLLLGLIGVWFFGTHSDGTAACRAAAPPTPLNEFAPGGISYLPPGYECLYIKQNTVEPLDAAGWFEWAVSVAILLVLCYGALSVVVRIGLRATDRRARAAPQ